MTHLKSSRTNDPLAHLSGFGIGKIHAITYPNTKKSSIYYGGAIVSGYLCHSLLALTDPLAERYKRRDAYGLNSLSSTLEEKGEAMRPATSLRRIIKAAILGSPQFKLSVEELCAVVPRRFTYYADKSKHEVHAGLPGSRILFPIF
jgi:hypothetical protein